MSQLVLAFDAINQAFVANYRGSASAFPNFRQGKYNVKIYLIQPTTNQVPGGASYSIFDATSFDGLRMGIWSASTGDVGDEDENLLALTNQLGWTYDTSETAYPCFTGEFNVHTDEVKTWLNSANNKAGYFAINLVSGEDLRPVFDHAGQTNVTIFSATDNGGGALPTSVLGPVPTVRLPIQFLDEETGELYSLARTAEGVLTFSHLNP